MGPPKAQFTMSEGPPTHQKRPQHVQHASWVWIGSLKHHVESGACKPSGAKQSCVFCRISVPQQVLDGVMQRGGALEWPAWKSMVSPKLLLFVMDARCSSCALCNTPRWGGCKGPSVSGFSWFFVDAYQASWSRDRHAVSEHQRAWKQSDFIINLRYLSESWKGDTRPHFASCLFLLLGYVCSLCKDTF